MTQNHIVALVLTTGLLSLIGCGGSSNTTGSSRTSAASTAPTSSQPSTSPTATDTASTSSDASFISDADTICRRVNKRRAGTTLTTQPEIARVLPALANYEQSAIVELRKLTPPPALSGTWNEILNDMSQVAAATNSIGQYALAKRNDTSQLYSTINHLQTAMLAKAKDAGFQDCARV